MQSPGPPEWRPRASVTFSIGPVPSLALGHTRGICPQAPERGFRVCPPVLPSLVRSSLMRTGSLPWPCPFSAVILYRFLHHLVAALSSDPPVHLPLGPSTPVPRGARAVHPLCSPGWSCSTTISRQDARSRCSSFPSPLHGAHRRGCGPPVTPASRTSPSSPPSGLPRWRRRKESASAGDGGDTGSIPGLGRSPGGANDNPLQSSCLENSMDRGAWRAIIIHGAKKSPTHLND